MHISLVVDGETYVFEYNDRAAIQFSRHGSYEALSMFVENDGALQLGLFDLGKPMQELINGRWYKDDVLPMLGSGRDLDREDKPECVICEDEITGSPVHTKLGALHHTCYKELYNA